MEGTARAEARRSQSTRRISVAGGKHRAWVKGLKGHRGELGEKMKVGVRTGRMLAFAGVWKLLRRI